MPGTPGMPGIPGTPGTPGMPGAPGTPDAPAPCPGAQVLLGAGYGCLGELDLRGAPAAAPRVCRVSAAWCANRCDDLGKVSVPVPPHATHKDDP
eukprot:177633-Chlamydomonas_euryale.AAC.1